MSFLSTLFGFLGAGVDTPAPGGYRREFVPGVSQSRMMGSDARSGCLFLAGPGGGKSVLLDAALCDAVRHGHSVIALATERTPYHRLRAAAPPGYKVHMIDPTVKGGMALDYTKLWHTQLDRLRCARFLSPVRDGDHNGFFAQFGQEVVLHVMSHLSGRDCRLGDLPGVAAEPELMEALGEDDATYGPSPYRMTGTDSRSGRDSRATVQVALRQLMVYAALSQGPHVGGLVNALDLVYGEPCAIVLVLDERFKHALESLFAFAFETVIEAKIAVGGSEKNQLHVGLDELPALARMEVVPTLSRRARKAFCSYYVGAQSLESVKSRYPKDWRDVLSLAQFKFFGRLYDRESAQFASDCCGVRMVKESVPPEFLDFWGEREGAEYKVSIVERPFIHWGSFLEIPLADWARDELYGVACVGEKKPLVVSFKTKFRHIAYVPKVPPYKEADPQHQLLPPLNMGDLTERLGFSVEVVEKAKQQKQKARKRLEKEGEDDDDK